MSDAAAETPASSVLVKATRPFAREDRGKSWRLLWVTLAVHAATTATALFAPWLAVQIIASVLTGLVMVRMFIFYHDYQHGAVLRNSPFAKFIMTLVGLYTLNPPAVWKETHDYHHRNNAKLLGSAIGSYPTVTVRMWEKMKPGKRRLYAFTRHPLTMATGYLTVFIGGMCIASFVRDPKTHWMGPLAIVLHLSIAALIGLSLGWDAALLGFVLPLAGGLPVGAYLFYVQHNYPDAQLKGRQTWDYYDAALTCSSMFDMSPMMHWFTGNIGYHHIHHLNHNIPFYRLPEAMDAIPALQNPGRTSWSMKDIGSALRLKLWDSEQGKLVGWNGA